MNNASLIDRQLGGKYQIQAEIGRGGMGIVYRALDQNLRRSVALKVLAPQLAVDPEFVQRFRHEAVAAASLRHPNIVTIHDVGADDVEDWPGRAVHYIVMEFVEGTTLDQWLVRRRSPMPVAETDRVVQQISSALQFAHSRGMIHRDIKPSNIMLDSDGQVKLMDFGLVRAGELSHLTRSGTVLGTPQYMAPEQITGGQVDRRTDLYSLGVVIYELLSGEAPFNRTTPMATAYAHVNEPPPPLGQRQSLTPKSVEAVVMKALAKDPAARYQTATQLAQDFSVAAGGVMPAGLTAWDAGLAVTAAMQPPRRSTPPPVASPPTPPPTASPPPRSRRTGLIIGAVAALLVLLLGGTAVVFNSMNGRPDDPASATPPARSDVTVPLSTAAEETPVGAQAGGQPAATADQAATAGAIAVAAAPTSTPAPSATSAPTRAPDKATSAAVAPTAAAAPTSGAVVEPTSTPVPTRPSGKATPTPSSAATPTAAAKATVEPTATATIRPTPRPVQTPCPSYLHRPLPGMGLLLIENHLGEGLHIDWLATGQRYDIPSKQGDIPGRLTLDMPPGRHDLNDTTDRGGRGHIGITVEAGLAYISPIWYNDRAEELIYPLEIPNGCR